MMSGLKKNTKVCFPSYLELLHGRNHQKPQQTHKECKMFTFWNI